MAARLRRAVDEYAADANAQANNVRQLVGSDAKRFRVGDFRVIFEESGTAILVTKIAPRGNVYDQGGVAVDVERIVQDGRERVVMDRDVYEDLVDARDHAIAMREVGAGATVLSGAELNESLAAASPLAYWRKRAGKTQAGLAAEVGVSQPFLAQIEGGAREGSVGVLVRVARALGVRVDDLVGE